MLFLAIALLFGMQAGMILRGQYTPARARRFFAARTDLGDLETDWRWRAAVSNAVSAMAFVVWGIWGPDGISLWVGLLTLAAGLSLAVRNSIKTFRQR